MAKNFRSGACGLVDVWILFFSFSYDLLLHIGNQSAVQLYEGLVIFCLVLWCYYNMSKIEASSLRLRWLRRFWWSTLDHWICWNQFLDAFFLGIKHMRAQDVWNHEGLAFGETQSNFPWSGSHWMNSWGTSIGVSPQGILLVLWTLGSDIAFDGIFHTSFKALTLTIVGNMQEFHGACCVTDDIMFTDKFT